MTRPRPPQTGILRPPAQVMRLDRLGALRPCRLSFSRHLLRRLAGTGARLARPLWSVDAAGRGTAVLVLDLGPRRYALIAASDTAGFGFVLFDGQPGPADVARIAATLRGEAPLRLTDRDLCQGRAQRDGPVWDRAVAHLAAGRQPDPARLPADAALIRVEPLHASGKAGTADRDLIADRPELHAPYQAELLALWLARLVARDLLDHAASAAGRGAAARLDAKGAQALGVGLTAGLGLAAFPVNHPCLFNTWIMAREQAIARVRALDAVRRPDWDRVADDLAARPLAGTAALVDRMAAGPQGRAPWAALTDWAGGALPVATQEALASAMLEPYGALVDGLEHCMSDTLDRDFRIDGALPVGRVRDLIAAVHGWALDRDWSAVSMTALAWSTTGDRAEMRLGPRQGDPTGPFELPLAVARDAVRAWRTLGLYPDEGPVAQVLLEHPEHRSAVRRAQISGFAPYSEIRDNLIDAGMRPDLPIRAMLAFLGADGVATAAEGIITATVFAGTPCPPTGAGAP